MPVEKRNSSVYSQAVFAFFFARISQNEHITVIEYKKIKDNTD